MFRSKYALVWIIAYIIGCLLFFVVPGEAADAREAGVNGAESGSADELIQMIPVAELEPGDRIFDAGWEWEHRQGDGYTRSGNDDGDNDDSEDAKPVIWIVAAIDHYSGMGSHVTLVSEEVVALYRFDETNNHWGNSSLRAFLNDRFAGTFSDDFRRGTATTVLPNKDKSGTDYNTDDKVFIPSLWEFNRMNTSAVNDIGHPYTYFYSKGVTTGDTDIWTRSPAKSGNNVMKISDKHPDGHAWLQLSSPHESGLGVRATLNLRGYVLVYGEPCEETGAYEIAEVPYLRGDVNGDGAVTVTDAIDVLRHIVGLKKLDNGALERADVSGSDTVSVEDAIIILRIIVGLM